MPKYKLSIHITITPVEDNYEMPVPEKFKQDHFHLRDELNDRELLINGTIKYFIDKFSTPKTLKQLIKEVKADLKNDSSEIKKTCTSFFKFLCDKNILVDEHEDERIVVKEPFLKKGDALDHFEIKEVLSDRGYIEVYLTLDKHTETQTVIKLLSSLKTEDEETYKEELKELEREYTMLKNVAHIPIMCKAYEFKKNENLYAYITLEYIGGISLSKFLTNSPGLTQPDCMQVIEGFLSGFAAMHQSGLIHGDIHSSNIMVSDVKNIKIIDLGYSRKVELDEKEVMSFGGVVNYMPPERINVTKTRKYTHKADLYSDVYQIGILMYLVLYNDLPFDGFIWEELSIKIKQSEETYPEISFSGYTVSEQMINIVKKCLHKKPKERYKNAQEILTDFKNHVFVMGEATVKEKDA